MSFSEEYKQGLRGDSGYGVDVFSYSYQMGAQDRGKQNSGGGDGAGVGAGGAVAILAVIIACCAFVIALVSYPIAAVLTGTAFAIGASAANGSGPHMNFFGLVFALMVPSYIVFVFSFKLEQKAGNFRPYRIFRQGWRMVVGTYIIYVLGTGLLRGGNAGFFEYLIHWGTALSAAPLMYLNSMRLDKKYELEPIRFRWVDFIIAPVKDRLVPKGDERLRETPEFQVKEAFKGATIPVQVANGMVKFGETTVPVANVKSISYEREHRGPLVAAGVVLPVILIAIIFKKNGEDFRDFFSQLIALAGLGAGLVSVLWGLIQATPPGKLQGPFRIVNFYYAKDEEKNENVYLKFARPEEERAFVQALENNMKAIPKPEVAPAVSAPAAKPRRFGKLLGAFKF